MCNQALILINLDDHLKKKIDVYRKEIRAEIKSRSPPNVQNPKPIGQQYPDLKPNPPVDHKIIANLNMMMARMMSLGQDKLDDFDDCSFSSDEYQNHDQDDLLYLNMARITIDDVDSSFEDI